MARVSQDPIVAAPKAWLDFLFPTARAPAPWERAPAPAQQPTLPRRPELPQTNVIERARRYLTECDPAIQGKGGHAALLWAARALVVGFELDDETAIELLWSDYNPRCQPPWQREDEASRRDLERKASEARRTPSGKPAGWALDEFGLRADMATMAQIALGARISTDLIASDAKRLKANPAPMPQAPKPGSVIEASDERQEFPVDLFPGEVRSFVLAVSASHDVDLSFSALPALAVAGSSMGNAWRLQLKEGYLVPPTLWVALVGHSSANKSGPLKDVMEPLYTRIAPDSVLDPMLNPQGRLVVDNATLEAVIGLLQTSRRGLINFRDELRSWTASFDAHKKGGGGGDEAAWLQFWNAGRYLLDRKTNNEQVEIPSASVAILGGIQPGQFAKCFTPERFDSGLTPRLLVACPPSHTPDWTEEVLTRSARAAWANTITWLRTTPFVAMDPNTSSFEPRVVQLDPHAKAALVAFKRGLAKQTNDTEDERQISLLGKTHAQAARLTLIHHGLRIACSERELDAPVTAESAEAGIAWARWCLDEQLRAYGYYFKAQAEETVQVRVDYLVGLLRRRFPGGATVQQVKKANQRRWPKRADVQGALDEAVGVGRVRWADSDKTMVVLVEEKA